MGRFDGRVVIVTGAARGQGEAEARLFAAEGATVVLADVLDDEGAAVAADIGADATYAHLDVASEASWAEVVATAMSLGPLRVLVNNAGILRAAALEDMSLEDYLAVVQVNQVGCFLGMRTVIAPLRDNGGGAIVNISSIDGMRGSNGMIGYTASKWAIRGMSKAAATELGHHGIRVNSVHPGGMMGTTMFPGTFEQKAYDAAARRNPLRKVVEAADVANAIVWLLSDLSHTVTGREMVVDAGATAAH